MDEEFPLESAVLDEVETQLTERVRFLARFPSSLTASFPFFRRAGSENEKSVLTPCC